MYKRQRLAQAAKRYGKALGQSADDIHAATVGARKKLIELAAAMDITVRPDSQASHLLKAAGDASSESVGYDNKDLETLDATELQATQVMPSNRPASGQPKSCLLYTSRCV